MSKSTDREKTYTFIFDENIIGVRYFFDPYQFHATLQKVRKNLTTEDSKVRFVAIFDKEGTNNYSNPYAQWVAINGEWFKKEIADKYLRSLGIDEIIITSVLSNWMARKTTSGLVKLVSLFQKTNSFAIGGTTSERIAEVYNGTYIRREKGMRVLQKIANTEQIASELVDTL